MAEAATNTNIKHDWYQTDTSVVITVLLKNVNEEDLIIKYDSKKVTVDVKAFNVENDNLTFNLLHEIVPEQCGCKITPSKFEIKLKKLDGLRWDKLEGKVDKEIKAIPQASVSLTNGPPAYPTSKGKDWNKIEKEITQKEKDEKPEGEEALNKLFQEIYGKGSDEVKKAMNKSYMESGGTVLSTNWNEIGKEKVKIQPPDGMEFKTWN
ncbi:unnamed protein product [Brassicogethes aeneus]|uniref:Protein SGT1 homolog n=1 Tax=Brassicogethes aeneus TaxID=1431903 RepID=A0A9P0AU33_BRAAE|nr:unnamed protein product [Brassicogethes aeneus]